MFSRKATYSLKNVVPNCSSKTCGNPCSWTISTPSTVFLMPNLSYSSLKENSNKTEETNLMCNYLEMYQGHSFNDNQSQSRTKTKHPSLLSRVYWNVQCNCMSYATIDITVTCFFHQLWPFLIIPRTFHVSLVNWANLVSKIQPHHYFLFKNCSVCLRR